MKVKRVFACRSCSCDSMGAVERAVLEAYSPSIESTGLLWRLQRCILAISPLISLLSAPLLLIPA